MQLKSTVLILCSIACFYSCTRSNSIPSNEHKLPEKTVAVASHSARAVAQATNTATVEDGFGSLDLPDGSKFKTSLYELKVIGQLKTEYKLPYHILSGRGCQECDEHTSIYIHSPSDGPMKGEAGEPRFTYPGRETNYEDGSSLNE